MPASRSAFHPPITAADCNASNVAICLDKDDLGVYSSATLPFLHNVQDLYQVRRSGG